MLVPTPVPTTDALCVDGAGRGGGGLNGRAGGSGSGGGLNDRAGVGELVGRVNDSVEESGKEVADCDCVREGWRGRAMDVRDEEDLRVGVMPAVDGCRGGGINSNRDCDCVGGTDVGERSGAGSGAGSEAGRGAGGGACWKGRSGPNPTVASPWYGSAVGVYAGGGSSLIPANSFPASVDCSGAVW